MRARALAGLEEAWTAEFAGLPFEARFLRDEVQALYEQERRTQAVLGIFAGLAILIAALGLLGLAAFAATRRTKEIGIRKSLGATSRESGGSAHARVRDPRRIGVRAGRTAGLPRDAPLAQWVRRPRRTRPSAVRAGGRRRTRCGTAGCWGTSCPHSSPQPVQHAAA